MAIAIFTFLMFLLLLNTPGEAQSHRVKSPGDPEISKPYPGDFIESIELIGINNKKVRLTGIESNNTFAIFIFSNPCHICEKNQSIWKRIHAVTKRSIHVYGVLLAKTPNISELPNLPRVHFGLYYPAKVDVFKDHFKLDSKSARTIIVKNNKIVYYKVGDLTIEDYFDIIRTIKGAEK